METLINTIPKEIGKYRFQIKWCSTHWEIGYGENNTTLYPCYQTKMGETLKEGLIKFKELWKDI